MERGGGGGRLATGEEEMIWIGGCRSIRVVGGCICLYPATEAKESEAAGWVADGGVSVPAR